MFLQQVWGRIQAACMSARAATTAAARQKKMPQHTARVPLGGLRLVGFVDRTGIGRSAKNLAHWRKTRGQGSTVKTRPDPIALSYLRHNSTAAGQPPPPPARRPDQIRSDQIRSQTSPHKNGSRLKFESSWFSSSALTNSASMSSRYTSPIGEKLSSTTTAAALPREDSAALACSRGSVWRT